MNIKSIESITSRQISRDTWQIERGGESTVLNWLRLFYGVIIWGAPLVIAVKFFLDADWPSGIIILSAAGAGDFLVSKVIMHDLSRTIRLLPTGIKISDGYSRPPIKEYFLVRVPIRVDIRESTQALGLARLSVMDSKGQWRMLAEESPTSIEEMKTWVERFYGEPHSK